MIFLFFVSSAFIYGAIKGLRQWNAQQSPVFIQRSNRWMN